MMESIEKLRELLRGCGCSEQCYSCGINYHGSIADEIEREIAEKYQLLPVDADGVPIHVGDLMRAKDWCEDRRVDSFAVVCRSNDGCYGVWHNADELTHVNPRTIEDVLRDVWKEALDYAKGGMWRNPDEVFMERADEIRELMEVD